MSSGKLMVIGAYRPWIPNCYTYMFSDIWFTMTFANDAEIFTKIVELNQAFVNEWKATSDNPDFITQCMFQSIPTIFSKHGVEKGGNVLGLDKEDRNAIMLLFDIAVKTADEEALLWRGDASICGKQERLSELAVHELCGCLPRPPSQLWCGERKEDPDCSSEV
jgi:hypothetical protein